MQEKMSRMQELDSASQSNLKSEFEGGLKKHSIFLVTEYAHSKQYVNYMCLFPCPFQRDSLNGNTKIYDSQKVGHAVEQQEPLECS